MGYDFLKQKKILLVDDEEGLRKMVCSILEKEGYGREKRWGLAHPGSRSL